MGRRWLIAASVALGLAPTGCGMATRRLDEEALATATTSARSFDAAPHRVALATFEAMRAELASAEFARDSAFAPMPPLVRKDGSKVEQGPLPPNFPGFRLEWKNQEGKPVRGLVMLTAAHFAGKARDGRPLEVNVLFKEGETLVTIRVDKLGDRMFSIALFERVSGRLAHPSNPPGSLEEAAAFQAFFGGAESREALPSLRPGTSGQVSAASGSQAAADLIEPASRWR